MIVEVAGVDGCPGGWLVVWAHAEHSLSLLTVRVIPTFHEVLERTQHCAAVGIDIPIGLSDDGRRSPDIEARRILRPLRHNSVFPSPVRAVLVAPTYGEACAISSRTHKDGKKISKQTYFMSRRIDEVDRLMTPAMQGRVVEVHPEVCFWALNNRRPMSNPKRSSAGEFERVEVLSHAFFTDDLSALGAPARADRDDVYDACAAAWTAWRFAKGEAQRLPPEPLFDARGLRMEIVY